MRKLYVKNYKGFGELVIDIQDFNFLVGENSTGKTSILKLISLLSTPDFWLSMDFNSSNIELGYYDEIFQRNCADKHFRIGIQVPLGKDSFKRILMTFVEQDSIPKIDNVKMTSGKSDLYIKFGKKTTYKIKEAKIEIPFKEWCQKVTIRSKSITFPDKGDGLPFGFLLSLIESQAFDNKAPEGGFRVYPLLGSITALAPIRAKVKRTYDGFVSKFSPEGDHIPVVLKKILENASKDKETKIIKSLEAFGKESNLFDKIEVSTLGDKPSSPFEINILYGDMPVRIGNVGYGVSQVLPVIVEILANTNEFFIIQQPEVHLHPKAQAAFGEIIYTSFNTNSNKFLIETHSDYTINRFRQKLASRKKGDKLPKAHILFFERDHNKNNVFQISIDEHGEIDSDVPDAYRDFFITEELKMLSI